MIFYTGFKGFTLRSSSVLKFVATASLTFTNLNIKHLWSPQSQGLKRFTCSIQLNMNFKLLITIAQATNKVLLIAIILGLVRSKGSLFSTKLSIYFQILITIKLALIGIKGKVKFNSTEHGSDQGGVKGWLNGCTAESSP